MGTACPLDSFPAVLRSCGGDCHYRKERALFQIQVFVLRAILGAAFAVVIARTFYPRTELVKVIGLAIIIVGLAYFAEYLKKRRRK
jgi:heme/copper-type cytochrome/quinol oxidase subunit 4